MRMNLYQKFVPQTFEWKPSYIYRICFSGLSFLKLVTLLHFIRLLHPMGFLPPLLYTHTFFVRALTFPTFLYSYSTLATGLIPRQSSLPGTFPALGPTYISAPCFTHIPILSSPGIYANNCSLFLSKPS